MLTWSYVFVLPVCTCLDYMKNPLLLLLPAWRPTWASYFKSERGEDEMLTRPYLLLSLRFTGMSFHYIKTTAWFSLCTCADYMKNLWISLTTWRLQWSSNSKPDRDGGDMMTQPCLLLSCALPELLELSGLTLTTWAHLRTDLNIIVRWRQASHQRRNILPECIMYALPVLYQLTYYAPCCTNCQVSCLTMWSLSALTVATGITLSRTTTTMRSAVVTSFVMPIFMLDSSR